MIVGFVMIKKEKILGLLGMIFGINLIKLVSAYESSYYVETGLDFFKSNYGPFFAALLGTSSFDEFLFAKILAFFLLFAIIWMVLQKIDLFGNNRPILFTIAAIVSILSIRFMGENQFLIGVLLPYGVLGAAILVFLPLLIYWTFIQTSIPGGMFRRLAWIIYFLFFLIMTIMRWEEISDPIKWVYTAGMVFVLLNILFDRTIHSYMGKLDWARAMRGIEDRSKSDLLHELREAQTRYDEDSTAFNKRRLKNLIKKAHKKGIISGGLGI